MSKAYEFIKECGVFFILSINGGAPAGRPFGAIMEYGDNLYISTSDVKSVYRQFKENEQIQIIAIKDGTRNWIRITGIATECGDPLIKNRMLHECPGLTQIFPNSDAPHFCVFRIEVSNTEMFIYD